ncbi:MAG: hypothetical protein EP329_07570 [Deltaproteobacteria bacterium]|nr:MAG: hypothetical protein EP329_07570 [Deltaproteobacteria bacterium]
MVTRLGTAVVQTLWAVWAIGATACGVPPEEPNGPTVAIDVAALDLVGVGEVVWDLEVVAGSGPETVWQRRVTSSRYGDGAGSAAYVGPCDADQSPNTVRVWVVGLYDAALTTADAGAFASGSNANVAATALPFQNPTAGGPLTLTAPCLAGADNAVRFDVTLARPAQQGFFDVAVAFNDIFCSAKFDCCTPDAGGGCVDTALLFDASGARGRTFVMGFACTAGPETDVATTLLLDDLALDCDVTSDAATFAADVTLDPGPPEPGNLCVPGADGMSTCPAITEADVGVDADTYLFQAAVYRGVEALASGADAAHKVYWNVALGVRPGITACTLRTRGTADDANDDLDGVVESDTGDGGWIEAGRSYPMVRWDVALGTCASEPLDFDDPTGPVAVTYTEISASMATELAHRFEPGAAPMRSAVCVGLPADALWNTVDTIPQVWDGSAWTPDTTGSYDETPTTTACHFVCLPNYTWDGAACNALAAAPTLAAVVPDHGTVAGGDLVTLVGTNYVNGASVTFDGVASPGVTWKSATRLVARVPAGVAGPSAVTITNPDTGTASLAGAYTYGDPLTIRVCEKDTTVGGTSKSVAVYYTADDCAGALPVADALGTIRYAHATGGHINSSSFTGATPGMSLWTIATGTRALNLDSVYLPSTLGIRCSATWNPGTVSNTSHTFTAAECGGTLPDASYVGVLQRLTPYAGAMTFAIYDAGQSGGPGLHFWSYSTTGNPASAAVIYVPRADVIVCYKALSLSGSGSKYVYFTADDCGGELPSIQHVGVMRRAYPCGGEIAFGALDFETPGVWFYPKSSVCGSTSVEAVFFRR